MSKAEIVREGQIHGRIQSKNERGAVLEGYLYTQAAGLYTPHGLRYIE